MVVQEQESVDELHLVHKIVLSLRDDVKDVKDRCDELSDKVDEFKTYMVRAKTQEEERQLPVKLEIERKRIDAIEGREAEFRGQIRMLRGLAGLAAFIGAVLTIWLAIKELSGH